MKQTSKLSRLMKTSWEIQKARHYSRSKSLQSAWAIFLNEDITVFHLVKRLSNNRPVKPFALNQYSLF
jgi:hypothetical protein